MSEERFVSRGFVGKRRGGERKDRILPGQYLTNDFPVLSAGPTPYTPIDQWTFTIEGLVKEKVSWTEAALDATNDRADYPYLHEGNQGLPEEYLDSLDEEANQSHHYAGIFFLGYHLGASGGVVLNTVRDSDPGQFNSGDIRLGNVAAVHGEYLSRPIRSPLLTDVSNWIDEMSP